MSDSAATAINFKSGARSAILCTPPVLSVVLESEFSGAFSDAKTRMDLFDSRFVEVVDPVHQALLEIRLATALQSPCNDFENR